MSGPPGRRERPGGAGQAGRVRLARLTDLAAVGELSRLSHGGDGADEAALRSLGLPVGGNPISVFTLFRMPLGALRAQDQLYVYEDERGLAGLLRAERDSQRDEWTIVELDAVGVADAGDIRFRLVQHLLRDGTKRGAMRFHVACADRGGNVELFMQAGFMRYGEEWVLLRPAGEELPALLGDDALQRLGIRPAGPLDAIALSRLYTAVTPQPVARLEGYRLPDWERPSGHWPIPRSSLAPILRFADVSTFVQACPPGSREAATDELAALIQVGVAKEDQPHYLRLLARPGHDPSDLIAHGLAVIGAATGEASAHRTRGVICPVRTYEAPFDRRVEEAGFQRVATLTLLLKETLVRVAEPAMVPAIR
ncbi:MAG: hypothetical protein ACHQZR_08595 [Candidatus Limnocylindrales bacterium]